MHIAILVEDSSGEHIHEQSQMYLESMLKTVPAIRGNCSPTLCIRVDQQRSKKLVCHYRDKSNMNGQKDTPM